MANNGEEQYKKYLEISQRDPSEVLNWERANLSKALNNRGIEGEDAEDALKYWASLPRAQSGSSDRSSAPGAVNQYLSTLKSLLKCTRDDTENSFLYASTWEGDIQISKAMPFVDRAKEIDILLKVLKSLFHWWKSVLQISSGQWDESYKGKGFSFTICGAASGIGKSTFARKAFVQMSHLITKQITAGTAPRDDPLIKLLLDCVERRALYRTTFVHITNWEISNPACSIAFRLLHAACKYMFLDKKMQFFPRFEESFPPPLDLKLHHVFSFVREVLGVPTKQPVMIVYHLDEMNHMQLESSHKQYTHDILAHMHASMIQSDVFLFPILTGTNAEELNRLKISSGFPISSINLGPLPIHYMRLVFAIVIRNLAQHVDKPIPEVIARFIKERLVKNKFSYQELEIVISDCGGNPQVLAILFGVLASAKEFEKVFAISDEQVEQLLKQIEEIDVPTTKTIRDAVWHSVVSSHILGSLVVRKELAEVICGFGLTGELVQRDTVLVNGVTVGNAESSGALYLLQEEGDINPTEQHFCVILPYIHYRSLQFRACCPSLSLLKHWTTNDRDNELHDIEYIAFRVWWLKHKTTASSFKLSELFPSLTFLPTQDVQLLFPSNFNITQMQMQTKDTYQEQILKYRTWYREMHFFLGPGKESFVDSWAVFNLASDPATPQSPGTFFSIMVQSRQTTVNGVTSDCEEQLKMCEDAAQSLFHLLVISDGIIEAHNSDKLHCVQGSDLDNFFGPVLGPLRRSTVELLAGVGDNAELTDEELMDEQELMVDD